MILSLILSLAAPTIVPVAPMIVGRRVEDRVDTRLVTIFDVEVRGGNEMLWAGQMRTSIQSSASFSRNKTDAPRSPCLTDESRGSDRSSLSLNINPVRYAQSRDAYQFTASWERPGTGSSCGFERNSRTIGLSETVAIQPGQSVTISGDGGLAIRVRRVASAPPQ